MVVEGGTCRVCTLASQPFSTRLANTEVVRKILLGVLSSYGC